MHLIFERYKGRFKSNCNILALAWMPYYQEAKFRQALFDYHQKQLINVTRSSQANTDSTSEINDTNSNNNNSSNRAQSNSNNQSGAAVSSGHETTVESNHFPSPKEINESIRKFANFRLSELYQRYLYARYSPPDASSSASRSEGADRSSLKNGRHTELDSSTINDELDAKYGRMSDFGWLAVGNIGKIVGITLTSTVAPPEEIDGRKLDEPSVRKHSEDLICLSANNIDDGVSGTSSDKNSRANAGVNEAENHSSFGPDDANVDGMVEAGKRRQKCQTKDPDYERVRPDKKCVRGNYNLRGHLDEIILVKWNELYQKLATVDSKGNVLIWCKVNEKFTIQTPFYNRTKSVADFKWSNDGKTALICYTDSFILVGSSSSQRHWHSMLNLDDYHITCASWAPDDEQLLLGVSNGNVVRIDLPRSELTELVVGDANIRTMCWSSCDINLRNLDQQEKATSNEMESLLNMANRDQVPLLQQGNLSGSGATSGSATGRARSSTVVNHRRLSRDCSIFSRYRFCSQGPNNVSNRHQDQHQTRNYGQHTTRPCARDQFNFVNQKNILAIDFANNTIKLFDGGLDDPVPKEIQVNLESYLMAWSNDGKLLAVAGFNIYTSAPSIGCLRCKYLNSLKFYNQQGQLVYEYKLNFTRYPITALTWAHEDTRIFIATGPRLHCARVYIGVPTLSLLAMSCIHQCTRISNKTDLLASLFKQHQRQQCRKELQYKNSAIMNWQSFNCPIDLSAISSGAIGGNRLDHPSTSQHQETTGRGQAYASSTDDSGGLGETKPKDVVVLTNNVNLASYQLPAKLKTAIDQLFGQTLRQLYDEQMTLNDIAWHVPKNQQRYNCTLICYTHELVDIGCGASIGHQYKTQELASNLTDSQQSSDQFKIIVLYAEYLGSLIPILKARRIGFLKPEFVIFDPEETSGRRLQRRQKVSDISNMRQQEPLQQHQQQQPQLNGVDANLIGSSMAAGGTSRSGHFRENFLASGNCSGLHNQSPDLVSSPPTNPFGVAAKFLEYYGLELGTGDASNGQYQMRTSNLPDRSSSQRDAGSEARVNRAQRSTGPSPHQLPLLQDPHLLYLIKLNQQHRKSAAAGAVVRAKNQPASRSSKFLPGPKSHQHQEARRLALERYRLLAAQLDQSRHHQSQLQPISSNTMTSLPETSELVRIRSNIWGTKFKLINVGNQMIAQRANLGSVTYKASILHLQPRQIFLSLKDMSNYCVFCSLHHHTKLHKTRNKRDQAKISSSSAASALQAPQSAKHHRKSNDVFNLIDLPVVNNGDPFPTPAAELAERALVMTRRNSTRTRSKSSSRHYEAQQLLPRNDDQKVVLPVGDSIRVAPKLEPNQRYKLAADRLSSPLAPRSSRMVSSPSSTATKGKHSRQKSTSRSNYSHYNALGGDNKWSRSSDQNPATYSRFIQPLVGSSPSSSSISCSNASGDPIASTSQAYSSGGAINQQQPATTSNICLDNDILTLSLDQADQVQVEMSSLEPALPPPPPPPPRARKFKTDTDNNQLNEFLEGNKTLKSIQTITKMIVDLSSKANNDDATNVIDHPTAACDRYTSPFKVMRASDEDSAVRSPVRYSPPHAPVHRPRRLAAAATTGSSLANESSRPIGGNVAGEQRAGARSVAGTPLKFSRRLSSLSKRDSCETEHTSYGDPSAGLSVEDAPLPPPPPSVPFTRKLSSSAKRFFDGSLRSLTGGSGYSTSDEPDGEDCEPLMSRRRLSNRRQKQLAGVPPSRHQSQPCTPAKLTSFKKPTSIDLAYLKSQLILSIRKSTSLKKSTESIDQQCGRASSGKRLGKSRSAAGSTNQLESTSCTRRSRWVHKNAESNDQRGVNDLLDYTSPPSTRSSSCSSSSSSSSSSISSSLSSTPSSSFDNSDSSTSDVDTGDKRAESSFMAHIVGMKRFGRAPKSARSLSDLAKISLNDKRMMLERGRAGRETRGSKEQSSRDREHQHRHNNASGHGRRSRNRRRRHKARKSVCQSSNCCCSKEFKLNNRPPVWNEQSQVYQLDFGGRVTQESAKNLQIDFNGNLALQFGRLDRCTYTLDYKYPFNAVQAMAVALASLTQRLK